MSSEHANSEKRLIVPQPIAAILDPEHDMENAILAELRSGVLMMVGDNPALPKMPAKPTILDFFSLRFRKTVVSHMLQSARNAKKAGHDEKLVLACLLHDVALGGLIRGDHGYWGAQMIAPYVDDEIAWAVKHHQALRFFADPAVSYEYPAAYTRFWGPDYVVPDYIRRDYEIARAHRWYMSARTITLYDLYSFEKDVEIDPREFEDLVGRHFRQPEEGLGFDNSPVAHMWRTIMWPSNFL
jgi:hypothetical protein